MVKAVPGAVAETVVKAVPEAKEAKEVRAVRVVWVVRAVRAAVTALTVHPAPTVPTVLTVPTARRAEASTGRVASGGQPLGCGAVEAVQHSRGNQPMRPERFGHLCSSCLRNARDTVGNASRR